MSEHEIDPKALNAMLADFASGPLQVLAARFREALAPHDVPVTALAEALEATCAAGVTTGANCAFLGLSDDDALFGAWIALYRSAYEHGVRYLEYAEGGTGAE